MAKDSEGDGILAQDLQGLNIHGQKAGEQPRRGKAPSKTIGEIARTGIQEQRKSLPIYKLRESLLQAIREVCIILKAIRHDCLTL